MTRQGHIWGKGDVRIEMSALKVLHITKKVACSTFNALVTVLTISFYGNGLSSVYKIRFSSNFPLSIFTISTVFLPLLYLIFSNRKNAMDSTIPF